MKRKKKNKRGSGYLKEGGRKGIMEEKQERRKREGVN